MLWQVLSDKQCGLMRPDPPAGCGRKHTVKYGVISVLLLCACAAAFFVCAFFSYSVSTIHLPIVGLAQVLEQVSACFWCPLQARRFKCIHVDICIWTTRTDFVDLNIILPCDTVLVT